VTAVTLLASEDSAVSHMIDVAAGLLALQNLQSQKTRPMAVHALQDARPMLKTGSPPASHPIRGTRALHVADPLKKSSG